MISLIVFQSQQMMDAIDANIGVAAEIKRLRQAVNQTFAILADIAPPIIYETEYINKSIGVGSSEEPSPSNIKSSRGINAAAATFPRVEQDLLSLETLLVSRTRSGANLLDETTATGAAVGETDEELFDIPMSKPFDGPAAELWITNQSPINVPSLTHLQDRRTKTLERPNKIRPPIFGKSGGNHPKAPNPQSYQPVPNFAVNNSNNNYNAAALGYQFLPPISGFMPAMNASPPPIQFYPAAPLRQQTMIGQPTIQFIPYQQQRYIGQ